MAELEPRAEPDLTDDGPGEEAGASLAVGMVDVGAGFADYSPATDDDAVGRCREPGPAAVGASPVRSEAGTALDPYTSERRALLPRISLLATLLVALLAGLRLWGWERSRRRGHNTDRNL